VRRVVRDVNVVLMVRAVLSLFDRRCGDGMLLFNGEGVVRQELSGHVALNSEWEEWAYLPELRALGVGRGGRPLPHLLL